MAARRPDGEALIAGQWPDLHRPGGGVALHCRAKKETLPRGAKREAVGEEEGSERGGMGEGDD